MNEVKEGQLFVQFAYFAPMSVKSVVINVAVDPGPAAYSNLLHDRGTTTFTVISQILTSAFGYQG